MPPRAVAPPGPGRRHMGILFHLYASLVLACFCKSARSIALFLDIVQGSFRVFFYFCCRFSFFFCSPLRCFHIATQTPADFTMALYSSQDIFARLSEGALASSSSMPAQATHAHASASHTSTSTSSTSHTRTTRVRYARIRAVHAGVPIPGSQSDAHPRAASNAPAYVGVDGQWGKQAQGTVPLIVILEPTYLGVLPATLLPTVGFLAFTVLAAVAFVPWVTAYLDPFIRQAREDLKTGMTPALKDR